MNPKTGKAFTDMEDYARMWHGIHDIGRPMVLTVEGSPPADVVTHGGYGNAKRVGHDISPSWESMISLVDRSAPASGRTPTARRTQSLADGGMTWT
jgi:hypothetical protein